MRIWVLMTVPIVVPVGIYLYHYIKRVLSFYLGAETRPIKIGSFLAAILLAVFSCNIWGLGFVVVGHFTAFAVLTELLQFILKKNCKKNKANPAGWDKVYRSGLIPVLLTAAVLNLGYWNIHHISKTEYTLETDKQLREEGYKIALITDLHFGLTLDGDELQKCADEISAEQPDFVVLAGDIVDESTTYEGMCTMAGILGSIQSVYGTFYVFGNHDKNAYTPNPAYSAAQLETEMGKNGITVLVDECYYINDELVLAGRDDPGYAQDGARKSMSELLEGVDAEDYLIVLDHQPRELAENAQLGCDLQLSGHTHGGQIWPVGPFCSLVAKLFSREYCNYGKKQIGDYHIIVSSGIAGWGYPIKTGAKAEYVIINIH